ncbi:MAG: hypothetical protein PVF05_12795 [Gemmatimonadales bacterium]
MNTRRPDRRSGFRWPLLFVAAALLSGCISGRVLEGYPGYPFLSFGAPSAPDSTFFRLQRALVAEGFVLDYTERDAGTINTRPADRPSGRLFLTVVVGVAADTASQVWVAGYEPVRDGARRINPLREERWAELTEIASRLSDRVGGGPVREPEAPGG